MASTATEHAESSTATEHAESPEDPETRWFKALALDLLSNETEHGSRRIPAVSLVSRLLLTPLLQSMVLVGSRSELGLPTFSSATATERGSRRIPAVSLDCQLLHCQSLLSSKMQMQGGERERGEKREAG